MRDINQFLQLSKSLMLDLKLIAETLNEQGASLNITPYESFGFPSLVIEGDAFGETIYEELEPVTDEDLQIIRELKKRFQEISNLLPAPSANKDVQFSSVEGV